MFGSVYRREIKKRARDVLKYKYWKLVVIMLIWAFCSVSISYQSLINETGTISMSSVVTSIGIFRVSVDTHDSFRVMMASIISLVVYFGVTCPMRFGVENYFKKATFDQENGTLLNGYRDGMWVKTISTTTVSQFLVALWSFLFVIPGLIRAIEYTFVPYILDDYPDESTMEVLAHSRALAYGHRMEIFMMELSMIPVSILAALVSLGTFGLGGNLITPYMNEVQAQMYLELNKEKYSFDYQDDTPLEF